MELRTVEVRWFRPGRCPRAIVDWFHRGGWVTEPERRTDEYLRLPDRSDLGVKRRAGVQLDLKVRTGALDGLVLPDGLQGRGEAWTKWSFPLGPDSSLPGAGSWISVEKVRSFRWYQMTDGETAVAAPGGAGLADACAGELVEVAAGPVRAWGFGFEAFASGLEAGAVLEAAVRAFVTDTPLEGLTFAAGDTHSYPSWLRVWPK